MAVLGDFCLDRYYEIDPARAETSIETGLPVHNVTRIRSQPGGAGTVLNNLAALGIGRITPLGFCGEDGEGFELRRSLAERPGVSLEHFLTTPLRHTFTYGKPLLIRPGQPPEELSRLDTKNWTATPADLEDALLARLDVVAPQVDALIVLDQVDVANTGVVTSRVLEAVGHWAQRLPQLLILADSRRGLRDYPPLAYKMNARELAAMTVVSDQPSLDEIRAACGAIAAIHIAAGVRHAGGTRHRRRHGRGRGGARRRLADARPDRHRRRRRRGDRQPHGGAGRRSGELPMRSTIAMAAASIVIHQLGTTGTATPSEIHSLLATTDEQPTEIKDPGYSSVRKFLLYTLSRFRSARCAAGRAWWAAWCGSRPRCWCRRRFRIPPRTA